MFIVDKDACVISTFSEEQQIVNSEYTGSNSKYLSMNL